MTREKLVDYYEQELEFIRGMAAAEFSKRYPDKAKALGLEPNRITDPHVERLIDAFALLAARVQMRLDDDLPEITDALLGVLYPHYLAPIPSMTIVRFDTDPEQVAASKGLHVERGTILDSILQHDGVTCRFRTCYPVTLWPIKVASVDAIPLRKGEPACPEEARGAVRIRLQSIEQRAFADMGIEKLGLYLGGNPVVARTLYETLFRKPLGVVLRYGSTTGASETSVFLKAEHLRPMGFDRQEGLLPYAPGTGLGYRILQEFFTFPEKFLFAEFSNLRRSASAGLGDQLDILVLLEQPPDDLVGKLRPDNLQLGCTPIVNLFERRAEPQVLDQTRVEHSLLPGRPERAYEVYSIKSVSTTNQDNSEKRFRPFYEMQHGDSSVESIGFYHAPRRPTEREGILGTDVSLVFVDRILDLERPAPGDVLHVELLCTNRDLPAHLPIGGTSSSARGDFQLQGHPAISGVHCLTKPSEPCWAPQRQYARWRLISHLSLNHLSIVEEETAGDVLDASADLHFESQDGRALQAFREMLALYDFRGSEVTKFHREGVTKVWSKRVLRQIVRGGAATYARGLEVHLELDEEKYGGGAFLFASVLDRFVALYTSINSFTETWVHLQQREGVLKRWPPRAGETLVV